MEGNHLKKTEGPPLMEFYSKKLPTVISATIRSEEHRRYIWKGPAGSNRKMFLKKMDGPLKYRQVAMIIIFTTIIFSETVLILEQMVQWCSISFTIITGISMRAMTKRIGMCLIPGLVCMRWWSSRITTLILMRSFIVSLLDKAEKAIPSLTPEDLVDNKPMIKPNKL
jgi:hypothetical protein